MSSINETKRLIKRIILSNIISTKDTLFVTPLLSGKHGIGKSHIVLETARDLDFECITIEGGTLKEGEITGIPYQYKDESGNIFFKFLPYYAIKRIQDQEIEIFKTLNYKKESSILEGEENRYSMNNLSTYEKKDLILSKKIKPVILFIDEINRTDNMVYRELMNIILTKTVNGYKLPWWVFFVVACNPSSMDSMYATNEMDPAQLDRFIKINVKEDAEDWITYGINNKFDNTIIDFIANNNIYLSDDNSELEDNEQPLPSPRGWEMVNLILQSKELIKSFLHKNELDYEEDDIKAIINSKVGIIAGTAYYSSLTKGIKLITAKDIYNYDIDGIKEEDLDILRNQSTAKNAITNKNIIEYLINNYDKDAEKHKKEIINKTDIYLKTLDNSSKLIFAQCLTKQSTINDTSLYDEFYDIFDKDLEKMVLDSMENSEIITNEV